MLDIYVNASVWYKKLLRLMLPSVFSDLITTKCTFDWGKIFSGQINIHKFVAINFPHSNILVNSRKFLVNFGLLRINCNIFDSTYPYIYITSTQKCSHNFILSKFSFFSFYLLYHYWIFFINDFPLTIAWGIFITYKPIF